MSNDNLKSIPIILATDSSYVFQTLVAISSIYSKIRTTRDLQIYLIAPEDMKQVLEKTLEKITSYYSAPSIRVLASPKLSDNVKTNISHTTKATYYRLSIPDMLPDEDSCLYLDGDILVVDDFLDDLQFDMNIDLIAGVKAAAYYYPENKQAEKADLLHIDRFDTYINAGVLLMNLKLMRSMNLMRRFDELFVEDFPSQDQDILNSACYGRIRLLDPAMNLMTKYNPTNPNSYEEIPCLALCWTKEEWQHACRHPKIIHYVDSVKPWIFPAVDYGDKWWAAAEKLVQIIPEFNLLLSYMQKNAELYSLQRNQLIEYSVLSSRRWEMIKEKDSILKDIWQTVSDNKKIIASLQDTINITERELQKLNNDVLKLRVEKQKIENRVNNILTSNSWKIGRFMTALPRAMKKIRHQPNKPIVSAKKKSAELSTKEIQDILLFDVSLETDNLSDQIIMKYVNRTISELFPTSKVFRIPTHRSPSKEELSIVSINALPIVFGTNIICPDVENYNLWRMPDELNHLNGVLFAAVGMNNYGKVTNASKQLYKSISNNKLLHSARDKYSEKIIKAMGIENIIYTGCITMWGLDEKICDAVPLTKSDNVVFTLTAHRYGAHDQAIIDCVQDAYSNVYFWPQGDRDLDRLNELNFDSSKVAILDRSLKAFEQLLDQGNIDYVGTRLHGGIHALNYGVRTIVIEVDNRAKEIGDDTGLPTISVDRINELPHIVHSKFTTKIEMPWTSIAEWKNQFLNLT